MKKKVCLFVFAAILALLILFAIIYTWPKDIENFVGDVNIEQLTAGAMTTGIQAGSTYFDQWQLSAEQADETVVAELTALLKSTKYRTSLRTLFLRNSVVSSTGYSVMLSVIMEDGRPMSIYFLGSDVLFSFNYQSVWASSVNKDLYRELLEYIAQTGTKIH